MGAKTCLKFLIRRAASLALIVAVITFLPNIPPKASIKESYRLAPFKPLTGKLAVNDKLNDLEMWHKGELHGPECIIDYKGDLYTGLLGGDIVKLVGNKHIVPVAKIGKPCKHSYEDAICGRPLGMQFDKNGLLYVADAYYGIWRIDIKTGNKEVLVSADQEIEGKIPKIFNSLRLATNGDIYFSHSSSQFHLHDGVFDLLADPSGRLIHYNSKTKTTRVLIDKVHFANGVILADDEEFVLVAETMKSRILRYYLKGPKKGIHDVFIDGLPGLTDNLSSDGKGGFLVPLVISGDEDHPLPNNLLSPFPLVRKFFARVLGIAEWTFETVDRYFPNELSKHAVHKIGHFFTMPDILHPSRATLLRISKSGEILDSLHATNRKFSSLCEAHIFKDTLYIGSFKNDYIATIPLAKIGWEDLKKDVKLDAKPKELPKTEPPVVEKRQAPSEVPKVQTTPPPPTKKAPVIQERTTQPPSPKKEVPVKGTTPPTKQETVTSKPVQQQEESSKPKTTTTPPAKQATTAPPPKKTITEPPVKQTTTAPPPKQQATSPPPKPQTTAPPPQKTDTAQPKQVTIEKETTPTPKKSSATPQKEQTSSLKKEATPQKEQAPSQKHKSSPQIDEAPTNTEQAPPPKQQTTPQKAQTTPPKEKSESQKQQAKPSKESPPQKQPTTPQKAQATPSKEESKPQKQQNTPSKQGTTAQPIK